jgi:hypothetical protein
MPQLIRSYQVLPFEFEYRHGLAAGNAKTEMSNAL